MDMNREETNAYMEYMKTINQIWQEQVDAGTTGRRDLESVFNAFKDLKERIQSDINLSQENKNALLGIIIAKMELAPQREEEILKAEGKVNKEARGALGMAYTRYRELPFKEQTKYYALHKKLRDLGYDIFLTAEDAENLFRGKDNCTNIEKRLLEEYPTISKDLSEAFGIVKEKLEPERSDG